ncbi:MAG: right-handed parallel beta-helix repeat-containing protein [Patescibacteria group bacterium]|nr:right-handed parallel beta-helix repeat-containing protein [Patescibacteria group bacterium]MDE2172731.1 right-handed parallel beta-helix repeat-containing protein [Patescibacteria group bacterium]
MKHSSLFARALAVFALAGCALVYVLWRSTAPAPSTISRIRGPEQAAQVSTAVINGLVGWWKFDDGSGTTAADSSGNGSTGTLSGTPLPAWTQGKSGGALSFDGLTDAVSIGDRSVLDFGTGSFSYGMWVYVTAPAGIWDEPWVKGGGAASSAGYDMELGSGSWTANIADGTNGRQVVFSNSPYLNQWVQLFAVVDRSAGTFKAYVDGLPVASTALASFGSVTSTESAMISGRYPFKGLIDDVRVYNRALSDSEVAAIYAEAGQSATTPTPTPSPSAPVTTGTQTSGTGNVYYVSASGSDANAGTQSSPWRTIQNAYNHAQAGDTILVAPGRYTELYSSSDGIGIFLNRSGTAGRPITLRSQVKGQAIIDGGNISGHNRDLLISGSYNVIDGFEITRAYAAGISIFSYQGGGNYNQIINNTIDYNGNVSGIAGSGGIYDDKATHDNVYANNIISHNGSQAASNATDQGVYLCGDNDVVDNNLIIFNTSWGLQVAGYDTVSNMKIYNNTIVANGQGGIILYLVLNNIDIRNNIIYGNTGEGYGIDSYEASGGGVVIDHNLIYGNSGGLWTFTRGGSSYTYTTTANITNASPLFVNSSSDFHLQSSSPAINAGVTVAGVSPDLDGVSRPQGSAYDMGAYEYVGSSGAVTTTPTPTSVAPAGPYSLTVNVGANGSVSSGGGSLRYCTGSCSISPVSPGVVISLTAYPNPGYAAMWSGCTSSSGNSCSLAVPQASVTVGLSFSAVPDLTAPSVSLTAPVNGATMSGPAAPVSAVATDNIGVAAVQFKIDGNALGSALTTPTSGSTYSGTWNTTAFANGSHTVTATVLDTSNNTNTSAPVIVTVNNESAQASTTPTPVQTSANTPTFTPLSTGAVPVISSGGGGGGGGGGGSSSGGSQGPATGAAAILTPAVSQHVLPAGVVCPPGFVCTLVAPKSNPAVSVLPNFSRPLRFGMSGTDVRNLQIFLNAHGYQVSLSGAGSPGNETAYFGPATLRAVVKFQEGNRAAILTPAGLTQGTGYFGPASIRYANQLLSS